MSVKNKSSDTPKKYKSKKFRVAKEGGTTDGRTITREWIEQMSANYDPKLFGARINLEHFKGILPDGPFKAYGDVLSLSTEEENGLLYLTAELDPTNDLIEMNKNRQKVYTSIEVDPEFSDTGEAYLIGLAVTDSPASLGTEMLQFSANAIVNPFTDRKLRPTNLFTEAMPITLEFSEVRNEKSLLDRVGELFKKQQNQNSEAQALFSNDMIEALELFADNANKQFTAAQDFENLLNAFNALKKDHDEFKALMHKTPATPPRTPAAGSDQQAFTDC